MSAIQIRQPAVERQSEICPACGTPSAAARQAWRFVNACGETEWLKCPSCRSYFMDGEYDLNKEIEHTQQMTWGDSHYGAELNNFKQRMYQSILYQMKSVMDPDGKTLLDVGCSYGGFLEAARDAGFTSRYISHLNPRETVNLMKRRTWNSVE